MAHTDPVKRAEYNRQYREKRREVLAAKERERYASGGKERQKVYRQANLDQYAMYQRNRRMAFPKETLVDQARYRAKRDGLPFNISVETLTWPTHCPVLGIELDYHCMHAGERKIQPGSPTLDRKVNAAGYVIGNVFVISHRANRMKQDASPAELAAIASYAST